MTEKDEYYNRAKQEGYRARSAYKLRQIDNRWDVLAPYDTVVDLGAAPGGWMQVASEKSQRVLGVDLQRIEPIEDDEKSGNAEVESMVGDITEEDTRDEIVERVGKPDVVVSDASPNLSGNWSVDHARSVHLARAALDTAKHVLGTGGNFVVKVFQGEMIEEFRSDVEDEFEFVTGFTPEASRDESSEIYIVAKGFLTAPVEESDELEVEIVDTGSEGDGIAKVEDFTLIVEGADEGETVRVRITEVKQNYAFAEEIE